MAKTRISISLDPDQAERIKAAAADGGQDVSAFVVASALSEAARRQRIAASFSEIDAAIAAAEVEADSLDWPLESVPVDEETRIREQVAAARARAAALRSRRNVA